jgi:1,4-dihydroxy-6-naphthoate synthase
MSSIPENLMSFSAASQSESLARPVELTLAHSPDSDDAFMFYGLATRKIGTGNLKFTHQLEDIQTLNQKACEGIYDITAISFASYALVSDRYILLPAGASFGDRYGPLVVAKGSLAAADLKKRRVAVPGKMTTAYLTLMLYQPEVEPVVIPFDQILDSVAKGEMDAGVVIHEGQLTYSLHGLRKVIDLGEWWHQQTGLPLPLGGNGIRRALDPGVIRRVARVLRASIRYSLEHREEALAYAMHFARGLDHFTADRFVSMYVNEWTLDYGETGRRAVQTLLDRGFQYGLLPREVQAEFAEEDPQEVAIP